MFKLRTAAFQTLIIFCSSINANCQKTVDPELLMTCFWQGKQNNCASIALIKAAISVYGVGGVFKKIKKSDSSQISLKNNKSFILLGSEITQAKSLSKFNYENGQNMDIVEYAFECYAVMAKMRQISEGLDNFKEGLDELDNGAYTPTVYDYLGLEEYVIPLKKFSYVGDKCGVVAWRSKHAVFC